MFPRFLLRIWLGPGRWTIALLYVAVFCIFAFMNLQYIASINGTDTDKIKINDNSSHVEKMDDDYSDMEIIEDDMESETDLGDVDTEIKEDKTALSDKKSAVTDKSSKTDKESAVIDKGLKNDKESAVTDKGPKLDKKPTVTDKDPDDKALGVTIRNPNPKKISRTTGKDRVTDKITDKHFSTDKKSDNGTIHPGEGSVTIMDTFEAIDPILWPDQSNSTDRIQNQIDFAFKLFSDPGNKTTQLIYLPDGLYSWYVQSGDKEFINQGCPRANCLLTDKSSDKKTADAVMFRNHAWGMTRTSPDQIWIFYALESPKNTGNLGSFKDWINWTATYRFDSDLATPYEKFRPHTQRELKLKRIGGKTNLKNYAHGKKKQVSWFVSNCHTTNHRLDYAKKLAQHIEVDIYGSCGPLQCSRDESRCDEMLDGEYRFYLAFENSNCHDYITEKFFVRGLQHNVIPIVMGATKAEYTRSAPPKSFIHVDDFRSPAELASYLNRLSKNDTLYNEYFAWKGTGEFINTRFWCRLCAMLNRPRKKFYDIDQWWSASNICRRGRWP